MKIAMEPFHSGPGASLEKFELLTAKIAKVARRTRRRSLWRFSLRSSRISLRALRFKITLNLGVLCCSTLLNPIRDEDIRLVRGFRVAA